MGQSQSQRQGLSSDDRMSLFIPGNDSIASLINDTRYDDVLARNYQTHRNFIPCRKFSKLKNSFSDCFRTRFNPLEEVDDIDATPDSEIISAQRPNSEMSNIIVTDSRARCLSDSSSFVCESLPRDIQDIRNQLTELKQLLSRPDIVNEPYERRDKSCQTYLIESHIEQNIRERDSLIARQQDQLNNMRMKVEHSTRTAEAAKKELSILKTQQSRRNTEIEPKELEQFISLLKSIKSKRKLDSSDLELFDEGVNLIASLAVSMKTQVDKSNIAIINPCSKKVTGRLKDSPRNLVLPQKSDFSEESFNQFHADPMNPFEKGETKMVYFLGKSPTPNFLVIPLPSEKITLATIKEYTSSLLPKDVTMKYFFKTFDPNVGQSREQLVRDQDPVPVIDGRIVVFIHT